MILVAIALLGAVSCSAKSSVTSPTSNSATRPRSTAKLAIVEPKSGATLHTNNVVVKLKLDGGTVTKVVSTNLEPNVGHIHVRLDGRTITLLGSVTQPVPVSKGAHVIEAEFVASDHGPFNPRVISAVTITVT